MPFVGWHRDETGTITPLAGREAAIDAVRSGAGLTWVHFPSMDPDDAVLMQDGFGFHPLAVEDCVNPMYQSPKVDDFGDYLFIVLHGIDYEGSDESVQTAELNIFVGKTWVVSATLAPMALIDHIADHADRSLPPGADILAYTLIDALTDGILPAVERMMDVADLIEDEALANPNPALLEHLIRLKRSVIRLSRVMGPQREVLRIISRGGHALLGAGANEMFFRDVADHLARIDDLAHGLRERADHAVTTYHSALSIRQNETMRILAVVSSIFLPLTLLVGIYGMNFDHMPELGWRYAYFAVLGFIVVVVAIGMWVLFGRMLMGWGRDRIGDLVSFSLEPPLIADRMREAAHLRDRLLDATRAHHDPPGGK